MYVFKLIFKVSIHTATGEASRVYSISPLFYQCCDNVFCLGYSYCYS